MVYLYSRNTSTNLPFLVQDVFESKEAAEDDILLDIFEKRRLIQNERIIRNDPNWIPDVGRVVYKIVEK